MEIESQIIWLAALYFQQEKFRRQLHVKANGVALWEGKVVNDLISLLLSGIWEDQVWEAILGISPATLDQLRHDFPN